jgi:GGDEF domain-containing protein
MYDEDLSSTSGMLSAPVLERVLGTTMHRADQRGTGVCVVAVSIEGSVEIRINGSGDRIDSMLDRAAGALPDVVRQCRLCRIDADHLLAVVPDADELEAHSLASRVRDSVDLAIRPRGIAPRNYRCEVGVAVYPAHSNTATGLIEHAIRAER